MACDFRAHKDVEGNDLATLCNATKKCAADQPFSYKQVRRMENLHRLFTLDSLLRNSRRPVPLDRILDTLECSRATFKRLLQTLRTVYDVPIHYSRQQKGYYYDAEDRVNIPGVWFTQNELYALLVMRQLLERSQPGVLTEHFQILAERVDKLLTAGGQSLPILSDRVRIVPLAHQQLNPDLFQTVARAVFDHQRLRIHYRDIHGNRTVRKISPQRLVYYRDHWYLDAYCHNRAALRTFWLAGISQADRLQDEAHHLPANELNTAVEAGYGIFAGAAPHTAHLHFTRTAAMRVKGAEWHPSQRQRVNPDGSVELWLPYSDSRELIMDILRYGADVTVLGPPELTSSVIRSLEGALTNYGSVAQQMSQRSNNSVSSVTTGQ